MEYSLPGEGGEEASEESGDEAGVSEEEESESGDDAGVSAEDLGEGAEGEDDGALAGALVGVGEAFGAAEPELGLGEAAGDEAEGEDFGDGEAVGVADGAWFWATTPATATKIRARTKTWRDDDMLIINLLYII